MRRRAQERPLVYALLAVAIVTFAVGVVYLFVVPKNLPSFLPGHISARAAGVKHLRTSAPSRAGTKHIGVFLPHVSVPTAATARSTAHYSKRAAIAFLASGAIFIWAMSQSWTFRRWRHSR
jgi:hypothetical protein